MTPATRRDGPPDDASDLWGYAPVPEVVCRHCGQDAEPWPPAGRSCWRCTHSRQAVYAERLGLFAGDTYPGRPGAA